MNVFTFDEDAFSNNFKEILVDSECDEQIDPFCNDVSSTEFQPSSYQQRKYSSEGLPVSYSRRKSSVYSRLSIKVSSSLRSQDQKFVIPSNFGNTEEDTQATEINGVNHKRILTDFVPLKVLGQGAYGKVYLVQDKYTKKLFAQKQLRKPTINIKQQSTDQHNAHVIRTLSERQILINTSHPNIVKLFYALQDHDKFYLILEYIPGGELFHHLASPNNKLGNVFKEDDVAFYAAEMALGLHHLHKLGIVYRDLKPENCLLNSAGHLVLTDFGLSKAIGNSEDGSCTSIIGTPEYMAPEILRGEDYDFAVDWWSLGCVIYDMMVGKPPFTGNSHKNIQDKIIKNKLQLPYYFSMDAKDLLNKLLNKQPSKRFPVDEKWENFCKHRFFRKINWKSLEKQDKSCIPPIVPFITNPILAENFDENFTSLKISDYNLYESSDSSFTTDPDTFKDFSYTASNSYISRFYS